MLINCPIGQFKIEDEKLINTFDDTEIEDIEIFQLTAKQLLEKWWERRTLAIEGGIIDIADTFNARQISLAMSIEEDVEIVDLDDKTIVIAADGVRSLAKAIRAETTRTMTVWDEAIAVIGSGDRAEILGLIARFG